jgi:multidrug resistance efflux pump
LHHRLFDISVTVHDLAALRCGRILACRVQKRCSLMGETLVAESSERTRDLSLRTHLSVGLLALALPIGAVFACARIDETVSARGRVDFTGLVPVTARVSARIERVLCHEGQRVSAGEPLFELDREELRARHDELVERARGLGQQRVHLVARQEILAAEEHPRAVRRARDERQALAAEAELAGSQWTRRDALRQRNAGSVEDADVAHRQVEVARARQAASESSLGALVARQEGELEEQSRALAELDSQLAEVEADLPLAQRWLDDATVRAPIDGVVLTADPERLRGRRFAPGEALIDLADPKDLRFVVRVDERDISRVAEGQDVLVRLDAFPFYVYRTFAGHVAEVARAPAARPDAATEFRVLITLDQPVVDVEVNGTWRPVALRPGLSGEGSIIVNRGMELSAFLFRALERDHLPKGVTVY